MRLTLAMFDISIHVPLAGDDATGLTCTWPAGIFLSTSPLRGTTVEGIIRAKQKLISIHVPLAGGDPAGQRQDRFCDISIHVPLAGDDGSVTK